MTIPASASTFSPASAGAQFRQAVKEENPLQVVGAITAYAARMAEGREPDMIDKEFFRLWFRERCDPYKDPVPEIPVEMIEKTSKVYIQAYEAITGQTFVPDTSGATPLDRVRANLAPYFTKA